MDPVLAVCSASHLCAAKENRDCVKVCSPQEIIISIFFLFVCLIGSYGVIKANFRVLFQAPKPECLNIILC